MGSVFVSYRRRGTGGVTARGLADALGRRFGNERIFIDTRLEPGDRYPDELKAELAASDVVIAVVDEGWVADFAAERRTDWVRFELSTALRDGKTVIPVLLGDVRQPGYDDVPPDVAEVTLLASARLRLDTYDGDLDALTAAIERTSAAPDVALATADPAGDRPRRPRRAWIRNTVVWAVLFGLIGLRVAAGTDLPRSRILISAATAVAMAMVCLCLVVLLRAFTGSRLDALTRRHQQRSFTENLTDAWPLWVLYLLVLGLGWAATPLFDVVWLSTGIKIFVTGVAAVGVARFVQLQVRQVSRLDTEWPPVVTPETLAFRRAATRLHELATAEERRSWNLAQQRQAESVLHALAEIRAELTARSRLGWRRWLTGGQPNDPSPAAVVGTFAGAVVLDLAGVAVLVWQGPASGPVRLALLVLGAAVVLAVVSITVSFRSHRAGNRRLAEELREWDAVLRPLVAPNPNRVDAPETR